MSGKGDVDNVVFPCGYTVAPDGNTLRLYYGAADSSIALASGSIRSMLEWLEKKRIKNVFFRAAEGGIEEESLTNKLY